MVSESLFWEVMRVVQEVEEQFFMILARNRAKWRYWLNRRVDLDLRHDVRNARFIYELPGGRPFLEHPGEFGHTPWFVRPFLMYKGPGL